VAWDCAFVFFLWFVFFCWSFWGFFVPCVGLVFFGRLFFVFRLDSAARARVQNGRRRKARRLRKHSPPNRASCSTRSLRPNPTSRRHFFHQSHIPRTGAACSLASWLSFRLVPSFRAAVSDGSAPFNRDLCLVSVFRKSAQPFNSRPLSLNSDFQLS